MPVCRRHDVVALDVVAYLDPDEANDLDDVIEDEVVEDCEEGDEIEISGSGIADHEGDSSGCENGSQHPEPHVTGKKEITVDLPSFLDFEASSFDGQPIEVAFSTADGEIRSWLIRPAPGWTDWSPKAEKVHGISREMLARDGAPVRVVARELNRALEGRVAYSDAPGLDGWWCRQLFEAAGEEMHSR